MQGWAEGRDFYRAFGACPVRQWKSSDSCFWSLMLSHRAGVSGALNQARDREGVFPHPWCYVVVSHVSETNISASLSIIPCSLPLLHECLGSGILDNKTNYYLLISTLIPSGLTQSKRPTLCVYAKLVITHTCRLISTNYNE